MRYIGPKFKLCRREGINLFNVKKYDVRKRRKLPGQDASAGLKRLSEYGKLLRNKQVLKRMYGLSEKQFKRLVTEQALLYSKNKGVSHDFALMLLLERRMDSIILKAGFANTIMQARQIVTHGHFLLNGKPHNIPSYHVNLSDKLEIRSKHFKSSLYTDMPINQGNFITPNWLNIEKNKLSIQILDFPQVDSNSLPVDILKVIEYYARA